MIKNMIYITGDTHGEQGRIFELDYVLKEGDYCIICGDWGYLFDNDRYENLFLDNISARPYTLLFVDGNHENFDAIETYPVVDYMGGKAHRIRSNIYHLCRGHIFNIEGKSFFAFGGGYSIDKYMRTEGISWWSREMPDDEDYKTANENLAKAGGKVDYIITHTLPLGTLQTSGKFHGTDEMPLNSYLENLARTVTYKHWYAGHFHTDRDLGRNITVLWFDMRVVQ